MNKIPSEIKWYLNESPSAMGYRSSFASFLRNMWTPGRVPYTDTTYNDSLLKVISRHRLIHKCLMQLPRHQYKFVQALYTDEYQSKYPKAVRLVFEDKTGLALCLHYDLKRLLDLCVRARHDTLQPEDKKEFNQFQNLVNQEYELLMEELFNIINGKKK